MPASYPSQLNPGNLIQTTFVWNVQEVQNLNIDKDLKRLLVQLYQNLNQVTLALNAKDTGFYNEQEFLTGQQFFSMPGVNSTSQSAPDQRQVFRKVINFGALPNPAVSATKSVPHNISLQAGYTFTRIYGTATNPGSSFIPLPYASPTALNENIELEIDDTDINITAGTDRSSYTKCYVVVEYIKS